MTSRAQRLRTSARGDFARGMNVGGHERVLSTLVGLALAGFGVSRRSWNGLALAVLGGLLVRRGVSGRCAMYQALGVNTAVARGEVSGNLGLTVEKCVTIDVPAPTLFRFWRDVDNLPRLMSHVESVRKISATRSHWVVRAPAGRTVEWDAEIFHEIPNELIAWRTLGGDVDHAGSVHFEAIGDGRTTVVRVEMQYAPPGGVVGHAVAALSGDDAGQQMERDLTEFKRSMEAAARGAA